MFAEDSGNLPGLQGINASGNPILDVSFVGC
jgi:Leucine-rich repeat (LRR) protein